MDIRIEPGKLWGSVKLPSCKAEMHRKIILGTLANAGRIDGADECDDTKASFDAAYSMFRSYPKEEPELRYCRCKDSAATLRLLLPMAGISGRNIRFEGSDQLAKRPVAELLELLRAHGMTVEGDRLPLTVSGKLLPGSYIVSGDTTSQYISGLLLALPLLDGDSSLDINGSAKSRGYIEITLKCLEEFQIKIDGEFGKWKIKGNQKPVLPLPPQEVLDFAKLKFQRKYKKRPKPVSPGCGIKCERDWSIAANYIAANSFGSDIQLDGLNESSLQPDKAIYEKLKALGTEIDVGETPDIAPLLAVAACGCEKDTILTGCERLRFKESDRIENIVSMINSLGGRAETDGSSIKIHGEAGLKGGLVDPRGDHRIAMAACIAAQICNEPVTVKGAECVSKSCINFLMDCTWLGAKIYYGI